VNDLFGSTELVYARRSPGLGEFFGGGDEHWEVSEVNGQVVRDGR
jgi:hypothetical protein